MYRTGKSVRFRECVKVTLKIAKKVTEKSSRIVTNCEVKCVQIILTCFFGVKKKIQLGHAKKKMSINYFQVIDAREKKSVKKSEKIEILGHP